MALEDTLASIDGTLKMILTALQSGNTAVADLGKPETKSSRSKKETTTDKATGAAEEVNDKGPRYFISKDGTAFYVVQPGQEPPTGSNLVSEGLFNSSKAEYEKKHAAVTTSLNNATSAPTATAGQGTASGAVTFKEVVDQMTVLSKDPKEGRGRDGVMAILNEFLSDLPAIERKVPKLEALKKNDVILAAINKALADEPATEFDPFA